MIFPCIMCQETGLWNGEHDRTLVNMQHDINSSSSAASAGNYTNNTWHQESKKSIISHFITFIYILFPFLQILSTKSRTTPCETRDIGVSPFLGTLTCDDDGYFYMDHQGPFHPISGEVDGITALQMQFYWRYSHSLVVRDWSIPRAVILVALRPRVRRKMVKHLLLRFYRSDEMRVCKNVISTMRSVSPTHAINPNDYVHNIIGFSLRNKDIFNTLRFFSPWILMNAMSRH